MQRVLLPIPIFVRLDIDSELSRVQKPPVEDDVHLGFAKANLWEEHHVDEVLQPSLNVSPATVDKFKEAILQIEVLHIFHLLSDLI